MDVKIKNGDLALKNCSTPVYINSLEELAQRVKIACCGKKGGFLYDRSIGSLAYTLDENDERFALKLEMIFKEASIDIPYTDIKVVSVDTENHTATLKVYYGTSCVMTEVKYNG